MGTKRFELILCVVFNSTRIILNFVEGLGVLIIPTLHEASKNKNFPVEGFCFFSGFNLGKKSMKVGRMV
jgi:hypothetical protein